MKILCGPDLHIRTKGPKFRTDNFSGTQEHKIRWILSKADKLGCVVALWPGDVTDNSRLPYHVTQYYMRMFKSFKVKSIGTFGQHDMLHHVDLYNTPLWTMDAGNAIRIPRGQDPYVISKGINMGYICIYKAGWNEEIPEIKNPDVLQTNILLIHKMFIDDKLWEGQEEFERASVFLRNTDWDLVVSGDNHNRFVHKYKDKWHVNCGSLMRQNIDQVDHEPAVYIYDTIDKSLTEYKIPIDPIETVMDLEEAREDKEKEEELNAFVTTASQTTEISGLDYSKNLMNRFAHKDIPDGVKRVGEEILKNAMAKLKGSV